MVLLTKRVSKFCSKKVLRSTPDLKIKDENTFSEFFKDFYMICLSALIISFILFFSSHFDI